MTLLYKLVPYILCISFLVSVSFVLIFNSASKETDISYFSGLWYYTKQNVIVCMVLLLTCISIICRMPINIHEKMFAFIFIISVASVYRQAFYTKVRNNDTIVSKAKDANLLYTIPLVFVSLWFLWQTKFWEYNEFYWLLSISILSLVFLPSQKINAIGKLDFWQNNLLSRFYEVVFIKPLKLCGRILWLAFDVMVVERSIIASISNVSKAIISGMHKIQENNKYSCYFGILVGILIVIAYFFKDIYK
jgi:hypothetical protein